VVPNRDTLILCLWSCNILTLSVSPVGASG